MSRDHVKTKARLYVRETLMPDHAVALDEKQSHYLKNVLRCGAGDPVLVFNENDGEFLAVVHLEKKTLGLVIEKFMRPAAASPDIWLLFAPLKKDQTDFAVQKATELGVSRIFPVTTDFTNTDRVNTERLSALATEAAEQCERFDVPVIAELQDLDRVLASWPDERVLYFCAERSAAPSAATVFQSHPKGKPAAILVGPEGGFSMAEHEKIMSCSKAAAINLGPRILKAETAVAVAVGLFTVSNDI